MTVSADPILFEVSEMQKETQELLGLIKDSLRGGSGPYDANETIDYELVYRIAARNSVANTVADLISSGKGIPDTIKNAFIQQKSISIAHQVLCDRALNELYDKLDDTHIRGVFLKGSVLKNIYPNPILRSMSDIDVYAEEDDMEHILLLMKNMNYAPGVIGQGNHYEYLRDRFVKIEFHPELVSMGSDYGRTVFHKLHPEASTISSNMDIWSHTIPIDNHKYARQLVPEYHYLYVIMHMFAHFLSAGTGIRSVMDVWIMNHYYCDSWDRRAIDALLSDYGLRTFEKYALALADKWFDLSDILDCSIDIDQERLLHFEDYILNSGTYGTIKNSIHRQLGFSTSVTSKGRYILSRFFLPYRDMKGLYPCLTKMPMLLPVMWVHHAFDGIINRRKVIITKIKTVAKTNSNNIDRQRKLIEFMVDSKE
ncbi:MAG: nucleotidyltransferase family protein [Clostridia bacterium]|nr:nucleotidyltransferase family protein [Clostridia bacterium]